jgi:predicted metal-dependent phosphoesterase TrpH
VLKVELHTHTADDPADRIGHTTLELIDQATARGFDALAVTLHNRQLDLAPYQSYAEERGLVLIPGIERTIEGKHVLLLNFSSAAERVQSFEDLSRLRAAEPGLVIAPHPFFPGSTCLRDLLDRHETLFDAVEWNGMFTAAINFNVRAEAWARAHGKPLVGNGDVHCLAQLGTTYSLVESERSAGAICDAIRRGRVKVMATPHTTFGAAWLFTRLMLGTKLPREWGAGRAPVTATP